MKEAAETRRTTTELLQGINDIAKDINEAAKTINDIIRTWQKLTA